MSVGGIDLFHAEFGPLLFPCERVSFPHAYRFPGSEEECAQASLAELEALFDANARRIACLVVEPIVQAAAGMRTMPPGFLAEVERLCREHDVLLFADEVATGFGRTGELFACGHEGVQPDLMSLGKGLTGGYLPVAATLASDAVYDAFYGDFAELKALYHGHSFTGNQLGCAVALASLDLFERDATLNRVKRLEAQLQAGLAPLAELPLVGDVRVIGGVGIIELVADKVDGPDKAHPSSPGGYLDDIGPRLAAQFLDRGLLLRPLGNVLYFMPPYMISDDEAAWALQQIAEVIGAGVSSRNLP